MDPEKVYAQIQELVRKEATDIASTVYSEKGTQYGVGKVPFHVHNGIDSPNVPFQNLSQRTLPIHWTVPGSSAATASNYGTFWIAPFACTVVAVYESHETEGSSGGDVTLTLRKSSSNVAITTFDLKAPDDVTQTGTISQAEDGGIRVATVAPGESLNLDTTGTLTSVDNVTVVVVVQY